MRTSDKLRMARSNKVLLCLRMMNGNGDSKIINKISSVRWTKNEGQPLCTQQCYVKLCFSLGKAEISCLLLNNGCWDARRDKCSNEAACPY